LLYWNSFFIVILFVHWFVEFVKIMFGQMAKPNLKVRLLIIGVLRCQLLNISLERTTESNNVSVLLILYIIDINDVSD